MCSSKEGADETALKYSNEMTHIFFKKSWQTTSALGILPRALGLGKRFG